MQRLVSFIRTIFPNILVMVLMYGISVRADVWEKFRFGSWSEFQIAMDYIVPELEIRLYLTKDNVPVIYPESYVDPVDFLGLTVPMRIQDMNFEELRALKYSESQQTLPTDTQIKSLEEFLDLLRDREMSNLPVAKIIIESKLDHVGFSALPGAVEEIAHTLNRGWVLNPVTLRTDRADVLEELKKHPRLLRDVSIEGLSDHRSNPNSCRTFYLRK